MKFPCFFCDLTDVGNLISGSSAFRKFNLYIWKFLVHALLKPRLKDFEHSLTSMVGFPCGSAGKESACNVGGLGLIPRLGRSPEEGKAYPLQYSGLENSRDCIVRGVAESDTTKRLSLY